MKWCGSPERKQFYDDHPADQESKELTELLQAGAQASLSRYFIQCIY